MKPRLYFALQLARHPAQLRHMVRWIKSRQEDYLLRYGQPWLVFDAIDFLQSLDLQGKHIFEYGSGGSTIYWQQRGAICVSVEYDPKWFSFVQQGLDLARIDYRLILPEPPTDFDSDGDPADPNVYLSNNPTLRGYTFRNYVTQIDAFPNEYFDLVLIDGRARPACIKHSVWKIKLGGLLILDDSEREYYLTNTKPYLAHFERNAVYHGLVAGVAIMQMTSFYTRLN